MTLPRDRVRGAVYLGEQVCPMTRSMMQRSFRHPSAGLCRPRAAGCMRIRFFADFAKIERMSIRQEFRKTRMAVQLIRATFLFCRKKGYTRIYGHSQAAWSNSGPVLASRSWKAARILFFPISIMWKFSPKWSAIRLRDSGRRSLCAHQAGRPLGCSRVYWRIPRRVGSSVLL